MAGATKVGPPGRGDYPKKPNVLLRAFEWSMRRFDWFLNLSRSPAPGADGMATRPALEEDDRKPSHGLPEAELPDSAREAAADRIKREDAIRRARGE